MQFCLVFALLGMHVLSMEQGGKDAQIEQAGTQVQESDASVDQIHLYILVYSVYTRKQQALGKIVYIG